MILYALTLPLVVLSPFHWTVGHLECGKVEHKQLYRDSKRPQLEDFPWLGRVYSATLDRLKTIEITYLCDGNLISRRHLIGTAYCLTHNPQTILFGNAEYFRTNNTDNEYAIKDIIIHPNYDSKKILNNIGLIHLDRDVNFNNYIKPICLPPVSVHFVDLTDQYLQLAGHLKLVDTRKARTVGHVILREECKQSFEYVFLENTVCVSLVTEHDFIAGSALMGINTHDPTNKSLYLVGILILKPNAGYELNLVFVRISSYVNWIETNMNYPFKST